MNWNKISKENEKAFKLFMDWSISACFIDEGTLCHVEGGKWEDYNQNRELYDFFDEQGIFIEISIEYWSKLSASSLIQMEGFNVHVFTNYTNNDRFESENNLKTRKEAETLAFTKSFEILENKLK